MSNVEKQPKWLYRLESIDENKGLWYTPNGEFVLTLKNVPGNETWKLPMGYDPRYKANDRDWFSACTNISDLTHWFSIEDVNYLLECGFRLTKWLATEYTEYEKETVFIKESCLDMKELTVENVFGKN